MLVYWIIITSTPHFIPSVEKTEHSPVNYAAIILFLSILTEKNEILKSHQV
jgi:DMSO/TMAO reductase YedYZ heme-binding membrane subunit